MTTEPAPHRTGITDVPGVTVGQVTRRGDGWLTGVTAVVPPPGTVAGVDVRGGGPGTHESDALDPGTLVPTADAVVLTGGSAYGLVAAHGVARWCEEHGRGFPVGPLPAHVVPIVPAATLFDLGRGGDFSARPTEEDGYRAALAAVNARGLPTSGGSRETGEQDDTDAAAAHRAGSPLNTTLVVVATDAALDAAEVSRTATAGHDGVARALEPAHTMLDGDTVFALATGAVPLPDDRPARVEAVVAVQGAAARAVRAAVLDAVASAGPVVLGDGTTLPAWSL